MSNVNFDKENKFLYHLSSSDVNEKAITEMI